MCVNLAQRKNPIKPPLTPEQKFEHLSKAAKLKWSNPEYRDLVKSSSASRVVTDGDRERRSARTRAGLSLVKDKLSRNANSKWANPEYRKKVSEAIKRKWSNPEYRANVAKAMRKPDTMALRAQRRASQSRNPKSTQGVLYKILDELGISYVPEGEGTRVKYYVFDCLVPKQHIMLRPLLIECQGDYWHTLPRVVANDKSKATYMKRYHPEYDITYIWEKEFKNVASVTEHLVKLIGLT